MIYLSMPYSDPDPAIRQWRFDAACKATAEMLRVGLIVISPVVLSHPLTNYGLPDDWQFWQSYDRAYLEACSALAVLTLDGWRESEGVSNEIKIANDLGIPFWKIDPEDFGLSAKPKTASAGITEAKEESIWGS